VSDAATPAPIAGKITASPNPVPPISGGRTKISWETSDPLGAEVRVSTAKASEKLVATGSHGSVEVTWIAAAQTYEFALYGLTDRQHCLDRVVVQRAAGSLQGILDQLVTDALNGNIDLGQMALLAGRIIAPCVSSSRYPEFFHVWEEQGFHITPVHFYHPIPDTRALPESTWTRPSGMAGLEMNDELQLDLLRNCFPRFRAEYENFATSAPAEPDRFYFDNGRFSGTDALVAYCMVRHFRPQTIIEIGSGYSSLISGEAAARNGNAALVCVEPFPLDFLKRGFPGLRSLIRLKAEDLDLEFFDQLHTGDILFIDSSHTVKIGGDVNYLFLEVLPRLNPGVIVHVHDISLPFDYRREWVIDECRFWTEQYLLQAFLAFNSDFEILFANNYIASRYLKDFQKVFPKSPWWGGGSFWMRRKIDSTK
jgi:hypothetical protein